MSGLSQAQIRCAKKTAINGHLDAVIAAVLEAAPSGSEREPGDYVPSLVTSIRIPVRCASVGAPRDDPGCRRRSSTTR